LSEIFPNDLFRANIECRMSNMFYYQPYLTTVYIEDIFIKSKNKNKKRSTLSNMF